MNDGRRLAAWASSAEALCQSLEEAAAHVQTLIDLAERKQEALMNQDRAAVEQIVQEAEGALAQLEAVESRRAFLIQECSRFVDTKGDGEAAAEGERPGGQGELRRLIERVREAGFPEAQRLEALFVRMAEKVASLQRVNENNAFLLQYGLAHTNLLIKALTGDAERAGATYAPGADSGEPTNRTRILDRRV